MTDGIRLDGERVGDLAQRVRARAGDRGDLAPATVISGVGPGVAGAAETAADTWRRELGTGADVLRELADALDDAVGVLEEADAGIARAAHGRDRAIR